MKKTRQTHKIVNSSDRNICWREAVKGNLRKCSVHRKVDGKEFKVVESIKSQGSVKLEIALRGIFFFFFSVLMKTSGFINSFVSLWNSEDGCSIKLTRL